MDCDCAVVTPAGSAAVAHGADKVVHHLLFLCGFSLAVKSWKNKTERSQYLLLAQGHTHLRAPLDVYVVLDCFLGFLFC